jgi:acyl-CoA thioesterase-1
MLVGQVVPAQAKTLNIVALGDSLTAGYMLPAEAAFPAVLEKALRKDGFDVTVANAGVSGDTTTGGLDRLDWSVPDGTDGVILELGANDMLRGQEPALARKNLEIIIQKLQARKIAVFLAGMVASPTLGADYGRTFNAIYPDLAKAYSLPLYPFFLDGVAEDPQMKLNDGMHPNAGGVTLMVKGILPSIEAWLRGIAPKG